MTNGKLIRNSRQLFKTHFQFFFVNRGLPKNGSQNCPFSMLASRRGYNLCSLLLVHDFHNHSFIFKRENIVTVFHPEKCGLLGNFFFIFRKDRHPDVGPCPALGPNKFAGDSALET